MKSAGYWMCICIAAAVWISGCQPQLVEREVVVTQVVQREVERRVEVPVEREVIVEVAPPPVERRGAWLDTIIIVEEPEAEMAITRLEAGDIDVYLHHMARRHLTDRVHASDKLRGYFSYGSENELTLNVAGPVFHNGKLNPFAVRRVREAMNWLIDREYIVQEIMGGSGFPHYVPINRISSDYILMADVIKSIELEYSHDMERARAVIGEEMQALGAEMVNGAWHYEGEPVELLMVIRTEDDRLEIGDYVAGQLERIGFQVARNYLKAPEAGAILYGADPMEGLFHVGTGGWATRAVPRDQGYAFSFFYTPTGLAAPLWQAYKPSEALDEVAQRLANNDFTSLEERRELMAQALVLSIQDSARVWVVDRAGIMPMRAEVQTANDLYANIASSLWPMTLRREGEIGGSMVIALPTILNQPWNPIGGTGFAQDHFTLRATLDGPVMADPHTGLLVPQRIESAELEVKTGLPVRKTLNWVELNFVDEIAVPEDAWADWDPVTQTFLTVGELYPQGRTALSHSTVYYPADLYETVRWHDGSPFSIGDVVLAMIMRFADAKEGSPYYDPGNQSGFDSYMRTFRGIRITSVDPLIVEAWSDRFELDAEYQVEFAWAQYNTTIAPWHTTTLGLMAHERGEAALSRNMATEWSVEWLSYLAGPSLEILGKSLEQALEEGSIPFAETMGRFVTAGEAAQRWDNLSEWVRRRGHYWIGSGPYFLERAYPVEGNIILQRYLDYPDAANKWDRYTTALIPHVEVHGPGRVSGGAPAVFEVYVTFEGQPYDPADLEEVKYILFDASGKASEVGQAEQVAAGLWELELSPETTASLPAGSTRLEVVAISRRVAIPVSDGLQFVKVD